MSPTDNWKSFFTNWPTDFPRSGIVISTLNETMPFRNFWLKEEMLLLERTNPDGQWGAIPIDGFRRDQLGQVYCTID